MITADVLGERARLTPERTALIYVPTGARFTYRDLHERALRCAQMWLETCGLEKGDRVAILSHNRVEFVTAFFAAAKSGVILVPLNTRHTAHELEHVLRDSGAQAMVYENEFREVLGALRGSFRVRHWIALDQPLESGDLQYSQAVAALPAVEWTPPRCEPEDLLCLLYTSGTTGKPKGVMIPHRMVAWNGYNTVLNWQLREDDISSVFTPLYHAGGLGVFLVPLFAIGGTIVLHRGFDAAEIWRTIERERCTVVLGVPTIWKLLMEAPEFAATDLSQVRWFISGGAPLPKYIIAAYQEHGVALKQGYGLTEVGVNCFTMTVEESARKAGSIGKPFLFTEARLVDAHGHHVAAGEVGELWLRGPHVCRGYWNNPQATSAALDCDGWFHTGDQARRDEEGFFYIAGRSKDLFISGGVNVYPAEIESEILLHPDVQDAAVIGVPEEIWGEVGVAFVVPRPQVSFDVEELRRFLAGRLAKYKIPRQFTLVESLPRTPYGKVIKAELAALWASRAGRSAS